MACALPVVATEVPGYMSGLEPGQESLTVRPKSWRELAAALVILARDPELRRRMGAAGLVKAQRYSWASVAEQVLEVYGEAIAAARGLEGDRVHDAV
jgi:glycosyltransferase involved in cell wall biosynthesis